MKRRYVFAALLLGVVLGCWINNNSGYADGYWTATDECRGAKP